jgi:uncharacterized protein DUF6166
VSHKLTNHLVFEPTWDDVKGEYVPTRYFLPLADAVADIHCTRTPVGGMRNADGSHLGDALVDIPQRFVCHSPTGFEWGYGGSGPADLALNVLGLFVPPPEAWRLHQDFKFHFIAPMAREGGTIEAAEVRDWIQAQWAEEDRHENVQGGQ